MMTTAQQQIAARSMRITAIVSFVGLIFTSKEYFSDDKASFATLVNKLPAPLLTSLSISLGVALIAQIWLVFLIRKKKDT